MLISAAILAGERQMADDLEKTGENLGILFQIQDDILDATKTAEELGKSNSDSRNEKMTAVSLDGIERSQKEVESLADQIRSQIKVLPDPEPLGSYVEELLCRQK